MKQRSRTSLEITEEFRKEVEKNLFFLLKDYDLINKFIYNPGYEIEYSYSFKKNNKSLFTLNLHYNVKDDFINAQFIYPNNNSKTLFELIRMENPSFDLKTIQPNNWRFGGAIKEMSHYIKHLVSEKSSN